MAYPIILLVATLGLTGILAFFIFPKILPVLKSLNVKLPAVTLGFMAVSQFLFDYGIYIALFSLFGYQFFPFVKGPEIPILLALVIVKTPFIKTMSENINMVNFAEPRLLLKSGVKIIEALQISADTLTIWFTRKR